MDERSRQKETIASHWKAYPAEKARHIDRIYKSHPTDEHVRTVLIAAVKEVAQPGAAVLDVGCGTGELTVALYDEGFKVTGLDISPGMLEVFSANAAERKIPVIIGDIFELKPPDEKFDVVVCRYVFSHYRDFAGLLTQIAAYVRSEGYVIFDSFSADALDTAASLTDARREELEEKVFGSLACFNDAGLQECCAANGLVIERRYPSSFFHRNPLFAGSFGCIADYDRELAAHLSDPGVQKFMRWFQDRVSLHIGSGLSGAVVNILKKS
jgi:ubiquinone/menaquinone biosynthesis C-methylase UbiE